VPRHEKLKEDEIKAKEYREAQERAIEEAERNNNRNMERIKHEFKEVTKSKAMQKYKINKVQQYNTRMIDFAINKDSELYATLKLPRL
jgi:hypothetical protein